MNKYCYIQSPFSEGGDPLVRRTVELKHDILEQHFGWTILPVDEHEYLSMPDKAKRESFILQKIGLDESTIEEAAAAIPKKQETPEQLAGIGGRKIKKYMKKGKYD